MTLKTRSADTSAAKDILEEGDSWTVAREMRNFGESNINLLITITD